MAIASRKDKWRFCLKLGQVGEGLVVLGVKLSALEGQMRERANEEPTKVTTGLSCGRAMTGKNRDTIRSGKKDLTEAVRENKG